MKILVVDDDKEIVQLLEIYIRNEGYEPISAYDGKEALTKLNTNPYIVLIILDLMMPEIDGMEVRFNPRYFTMPLVSPKRVLTDNLEVLDLSNTDLNSQIDRAHDC